MNFRRLMQHDLLQDSLLIAAPGLSILTLINQWIESVTDKQLVFLINSREDNVQSENIIKVPESIKPSDRSKLYHAGGCILVSSDALVKDWLNGGVPAEKVSGILVLHAEKVTECSYETFLLQLYREQNRDGFLKAFSEDPVAFGGFNKMEKILKYLQLQKVYLWPRFHVLVHQEIEKVEVDLEEYHQPMTLMMEDLQKAIIDVMDQLLLDLRRGTSLETDMLTVENAMSKSFDYQLQSLLDSTWHKLQRQTIQAVKDLKFMRKLLVHLIEYDCVQFLDYLENIVMSESIYSDGTAHAQWLMKDAAVSIISIARRRVYNLEAKEDGSKELVKVLEMSPKWELLKDLVMQTKAKRILIMVTEESTARYLSVYLLQEQDEDEEHHPFMLRQFGKFCGKTKRMRTLRKQLMPQQDQQKQVEAPAKQRAPERKRQRRSRGGTQNQQQPKVQDGPLEGYVNIETEDEDMVEEPSQSLDGQYEITAKKEFDDEESDFESGVQPIHILEEDHICISTYEPQKYGMDEKLLQNFIPELVIMFDAEPSFIRKIELFQCLNPQHQVKVQFLLYEKSAEEQMFLTKIRSEKLVFERLIREKSLMAHREHHMPVALNQQQKSSRIGGGQVEYSLPELHPTMKLQDKPLIVVDHREFKSQLPVALHNKGFYVRPIHINVGDYVLTPNTCVERKSLSDLIGSIGKGRLYSQVEQMCTHYKVVVLLIEFDGAKQFTLDGVTVSTAGGKYIPVIQKLVHYSVTFPKLRIIWSPSVQATCDIFEDLKKNQPDPDVLLASRLGKEVTQGNDDGMAVTYNNLSCDMLENMPGLNGFAWRYIAHNVQDLDSLTKLTEEKIAEFLGNTDSARGLYEFIHNKFIK